jgi:hypothetical protein
MGPVTLGDLRVKVEEGSLNPRLDLVWTQGMSGWKPAGEVEGLFEKRPPPMPEEPLAPRADPYTAPKLESVEAMMGRIVDWQGSRRRGFIIATILFPLVWHGVITLSGGVLIQQFGQQMMGVIGMGLAVVPVLVGIYFGLSRLVNLGMSRWWYLVNFVPIFNFWVGYRCFACPAGYAYHKKLDGVGVALALFYWLFVVLVILSIVAVVALWFGAFGTLELQEQVREVIRIAYEQAAKL